jgi:UDPglucose 6-dehydrogenase
MPHFLRLTVLGAGYQGVIHAACVASLGFEVFTLDTDAAKSNRLKAGQIVMHQPGLQELLDGRLRNGRLRFTTSYQEVAEFDD